ncbi:MAG: hypothetical protein HFE57_10335 [Firmicutes bacterium]|jgi:hypothetical protein|nr:hypothetical protein [Bacillota bacterium]
MTKDRDVVQEWIQTQNEVLQFFQCEGEFFIKPLDYEWTIRHTEDFYFLSYWIRKNKRVDAVIVKKNGLPMVYRKREYTMVVAIDCVKIAFVFRNSQQIDVELE